MIRIVQIEERFAEELEELQRVCFPTLAEHELMTAEHFLSHCRVFPEGDFVALDADEENGEENVVGLGSGFLVDFDLEEPNHSFQEIIDGGYYTNHDPDGDWYYGGDISVHPEYRGLGIGRKLYEARKELAQRLDLRGIVAGGVLPGYSRYQQRLAVPEYVEKVVAGELTDPTLSFQLKNGFEVRGMLEDYIDDSATGGWATLIVWENPDYDG